MGLRGHRSGLLASRARAVSSSTGRPGTAVRIDAVNPFPVRAITLDLDDTLWPFAPIGARVEQVLHDWLPRTARAPPSSSRSTRMRAAARARSTPSIPHLAHDFSALRQLTPGARDGASGDDPAHAEAGLRGLLRRAQPRRVLSRRARRAASASPRACRWRRSATAMPTCTRIGAAHAFRLPARRARARRAQAGRQHLPRRLRAPGRRARPTCCTWATTSRWTSSARTRAGLRTCWINRDRPRAGRTTTCAPTSNSPPSTALADWLDAQHTTRTCPERRRMSLPALFRPADADAALPLHVRRPRADFAAWRAAQPARAGSLARCAGLRRPARGSRAAVAGRRRHRRRGDRRRRSARSRSYGACAVRAAAAGTGARRTARPTTRAALQLGWGLGSYRFSRYKQPLRAPARCCCAAPTRRRCWTQLAACMRVRDLVNTPTEHMGPTSSNRSCCETRRALRREDRSRSAATTCCTQQLPGDPCGRPRLASRAAPDRAALGRRRRIRTSPSSARACASTPAASTSSRPTACAT